MLFLAASAESVLIVYFTLDPRHVVSLGYITTWAYEVYYVSSDFNTLLVRMELYSVFTSSDSYRDFCNCLNISDFFQICTVKHLDLNNLLRALLIFSPAIVHPNFR